MPLAPSTATRSPYQISRSNGNVRSSSSRSVQITARLPVRPPRRFIRSDCSFGGSGGGPASSNRRSRVCADWYREAMSELYAAFCLYISTSSRSFSRSSSQRRRTSSSRSWRCARASCQDAKPPGCVHALPPSTATTRSGGLGQQLPVVRHVQHRLGRLAQPRLQPALARYVQEVVRLVEQQHLVAAAQQQVEREPLLLAAGEGPDRTVPHLVPRLVQHRHGDRVEQHLGVVPAGLAPAGQRVGVRDSCDSLRVVERAGGAVQPLAGRPQRRRHQGQRQVGRASGRRRSCR